MIAGQVSTAREMLVSPIVRGPGGDEQAIHAAIDTGFNDELTLPEPLISALADFHTPHPRKLPWRAARS